MAQFDVFEEPESEALPRDELRVEVVPGRRLALSGVRNFVRVVLRIRTPADAGTPQRPPVSVACVLDRSGSMRGSKIDFAIRACKKLVKHLNAGDTLHFITYDVAVQTIFENGDLSNEGKEVLRVRIDAINAGGATNLFGGLERAATLLGSRAPSPEVLSERASPNRTLIGRPSTCNASEQVRRIFLFSDGMVNTGVTDPHVIKQHVSSWAAEGITTTTFGIGSEFDESLMRCIADAGKGSYHFLATAEDIPKYVSKSIHDLLNLYASEASIDIRGGLHTTIAKVYRPDDDGDGNLHPANTGLLQLGDLHKANERMVLMELDIAPPGGTPDGQVFKAAEWILRFQRDGVTEKLTGSVGLAATNQRISLGDEAASVQAMFAIRNASDMELETAQYLSQGDTSRAKDVKFRQISLLKDTLKTARNDIGVETVDVNVLDAVLHRAECVAGKLKDGEDKELVRRHCVQETGKMRDASIAGFVDGVDSSDTDMSDSGHKSSYVSLTHAQPLRISHSSIAQRRQERLDDSRCSTPDTPRSPSLQLAPTLIGLKRNSRNLLSL
jgi:hypothetical protein